MSSVPSHPVTPAVRAAASWSWRLLAIGLAVAGGVWIVAQLLVIVVPVAVALLLTVLLHPAVTFLNRWMPRGAAVGVAVAGMLLVVVGLLAAAGASIANGIGGLWDKAQTGFADLMTWLAEGPLEVSPDDVDHYVDQATDALSGFSSQLLSGAAKATVTAGHIGAGTLIALFCLVFFLLDGRGIWTWLVGLLPKTARTSVHQAGRRGWVTLSGYVRTQVLVAAVDAVGIGVGAAALRLPMALSLGVLVFLGSFIPIVGALATGAVAVLVALVAGGPWTALWMLIIVIGVQQVEGHVLQPFLMGHAVSLHPMAVLLAVAAGSVVAGIVGALFAVPLVAVANTVMMYLHGHDKFPELGTDDSLDQRRQPDPEPDSEADDSVEETVDAEA
ncbi:MAG: AI-2E family transporter [Micrococcales bacterium]|nr:AI-2E family transporter [Micrococcales bacterium]